MHESKSTKDLVVLRDVKFRWKTSSTLLSPTPWVLELPHLAIAPGSRVFLKGASGSGKTTLLNLIAGVMVPQQGEVCVAGTVLSALRATRRDRFRADHIGFIFQLFNLIPYLSVLDNVTLPLMFSPSRKCRLEAPPDATAKQLLHTLGLPHDVLHRKVTALSIGQQQRVAAARAIIGYPPLLIADEPTSALDADTQARFIELLFRACDAGKMTLLFVSHNPALEPLFETSLTLSDINLAASETPASP